MKVTHKGDITPAEKTDGKSENQLRRQSLIAHLRDLRRALIISLGAVMVGFLIVFFGFSEKLIAYLTNSLTSQGIVIIYTALTESLTVQIKASFIAGCILAAPIVLWQVWSFVIPALYKKERLRFTFIYLAAILLFTIGVIFAYYIVFIMAVNFFLVTGENLATPMISIETFIGFLFAFILPFGVAFELPIAITLILQMGLVTTDTLIRIRKYVILVIFTLAAILTPPDVISQVMLGIPLVLLYEAGILIFRISNLGKKSKNKKSASK